MAVQFIAEAEPRHLAALFQPEDGTKRARDQKFSEAGCSEVAPSECPLCFPLDAWYGLDCLQEVCFCLRVLDMRDDEERYVLLWMFLTAI